MLYRFLRNFWPQLFLFTLVLAFFIRLFFPPSFFYTPWLGLSDLLHLNIPLKYVLSTSLKTFSIPLWNSQVGGGYPLFAEGQIGTFYLPNLLIFSLLPFTWAIPFIYVVSFLIGGFGMLYLLATLRLPKPAALFGAIAFTFSSAMVLHVQHINFLQTISLIPWVIAFFLKFVQKPSLRLGLVLSFLLSQLFFAGFVQTFVYLLILLSVLFFILWLFESGDFKVPMRAILSIFLFSLILSAAQLIPSMELKGQSQRSSGLSPRYILDAYPFAPKHLLTFLNPFILENPRVGRYSSTKDAATSSFGEATNYIGLIPFVLAFGSIGYFLLKRPKNNFFFITILTLVALLLALGKYSPFFPLYIFPPLNIFRIPARFSPFVQVFLIILAAWGLKRATGYLPERYQKPAYFFVIILTIGDLFFNFWNFNPIAKSEEILKPPETAQYLKTGNDFRMQSFDPNINWNDIFEHKGWKNQGGYFMFFLNSEMADYNLFSNINHLVSYSALPLNRYNLEQHIIHNDKNVRVNGGKLVIEAKTKAALDLYAVKYLVSALPVESSGYQKLFEISKDKYHYLVYESDSARPRASFFYDYRKINKVDDYWDAFGSEDVSGKAILENDVGSLEQGAGEASILVSKNNYVSVGAKTSKKGILVLSDSFYPGWKAKIDSKPAQILAANINSRAIVVPAGEHIVEFSYEPLSFKFGAGISLLSYLLLVILFFRNKFLFWKVA